MRTILNREWLSIAVENDYRDDIKTIFGMILQNKNIQKLTTNQLYQNFIILIDKIMDYMKKFNDKGKTSFKY